MAKPTLPCGELSPEGGMVIPHDVVEAIESGRWCQKCGWTGRLIDCGIIAGNTIQVDPVTLQGKEIPGTSYSTCPQCGERTVGCDQPTVVS